MAGKGAAAILTGLLFCLGMALAGEPDPCILRSRGTGTAEAAKPRTPRFSIKVGYAIGFPAGSSSISWSEQVYQESARYGVDYNFGEGHSFRVSLGYMFTNRLGIDLGLDLSSRDIDVANSASIPHPLYFNSPRTAEQAADYTISENAVLLNIRYSILFGRFGLDLDGGPALFLMSAELTSDITFAESAYPYDTVSITSPSEKTSENALGFNCGGRLNYNLAKGFAICLDVRYSSAKAHYAPSSGIPETSLTLGGFTLGGGLKVVF
jgi:opacity protein-like surface antigen